MPAKSKSTVRRAYSYVRFSSPQQLKGDSLRRQLSLSTEYANRHGLVVDDTLKLQDLGVSAYKGKHLESGALGGFLKAIEQGRVLPGSVLLVEALDRISRQEPWDAMEVLRKILKAGISIVTVGNGQELSPENCNDTGRLMVVVMSLCLAHEESDKKAKRMRQVWAAKRASASDKPMTSKVPAWIETDGRTLKLIPKAANAVRLIFRLALDGHGSTAIAKKLNKDRVPTIGRATKWHRSYVNNVLHNRAAIGEFQPHSFGKASGEPLRDYFPAVVSEATFYRVQAAASNRQSRVGPQGKTIANLFTGLLHDVRDGQSLVLVNKGRKQLVNSAARLGVDGSMYFSFPYDVFESAFLFCVNELKPSDLIVDDEHGTNIATAISDNEAKAADLAQRIETIQQRLATDKDFASLIDVLKRLETERNETLNLVEQLKTESHKGAELEFLDTAKDTINKAMSLLDGQGLTRMRTKLKALIRRLVSDIPIMILDVERGGRTFRCLKAQVEFAAGGQRSVICVTRRGRSVISFNYRLDMANPFDLRTAQPEQVEREVLTWWKNFQPGVVK